MIKFTYGKDANNLQSIQQKIQSTKKLIGFLLSKYPEPIHNRAKIGKLRQLKITKTAYYVFVIFLFLPFFASFLSFSTLSVHHISKHFSIFANKGKQKIVRYLQNEAVIKKFEYITA